MEAIRSFRSVRRVTHLILYNTTTAQTETLWISIDLNLNNSAAFLTECGKSDGNKIQGE